MVPAKDYAMGSVSTELEIMSFCSITDAHLFSYIPVKVDYTDLYDILAFFIGGPDGRNGHDELGKKIAKQGQEWAKYHWREVDMQGKASAALIVLKSRLNPVCPLQHTCTAFSWNTRACLNAQSQTPLKPITRRNES